MQHGALRASPRSAHRSFADPSGETNTIKRKTVEKIPSRDPLSLIIRYVMETC